MRLVRNFTALMISPAVLSAILGCSLATSNAAGNRARYRVVTPRACRITGAWDVAGKLVPAPAVVRCAIAVYPPELRAEGESGEVTVRVAVDSAGVPDSASMRVVHLVGNAQFEQAVRAAVPFMRFGPQASGTTRATIIELPTTFAIAQ